MTDGDLETKHTKTFSSLWLICALRKEQQRVWNTFLSWNRNELHDMLVEHLRFNAKSRASGFESWSRVPCLGQSAALTVSLSKLRYWQAGLMRMDEMVMNRKDMQRPYNGSTFDLLAARHCCVATHEPTSAYGVLRLLRQNNEKTCFYVCKGAATWVYMHALISIISSWCKSDVEFILYYPCWYLELFLKVWRPCMISINIYHPTLSFFFHPINFLPLYGRSTCTETSTREYV